MIGFRCGIANSHPDVVLVPLRRSTRAAGWTLKELVLGLAVLSTIVVFFGGGVLPWVQDIREEARKNQVQDLPHCLWVDPQHVASVASPMAVTELPENSAAMESK